MVFFYNSFCSQGLGGSALPLEIFTLCTIFGRMPGTELELLRPQPGVLLMSYTHGLHFYVIYMTQLCIESLCDTLKKKKIEFRHHTVYHILTVSLCRESCRMCPALSNRTEYPCIYVQYTYIYRGELYGSVVV